MKVTPRVNHEERSGSDGSSVRVQSCRCVSIRADGCFPSCGMLSGVASGSKQADRQRILYRAACCSVRHRSVRSVQQTMFGILDVRMCMCS